jgi:hypothetical protein
MAGLLLYKRLSKEEIDKYYQDTLVNIPIWFKENPRRRVCHLQWVYGEVCKIRKQHIEKDMLKVYKKTILELFKK